MLLFTVPILHFFFKITEKVQYMDSIKRFLKWPQMQQTSVFRDFHTVFECSVVVLLCFQRIPLENCIHAPASHWWDRSLICS